MKNKFIYKPPRLLFLTRCVRSQPASFLCSNFDQGYFQGFQIKPGTKKRGTFPISNLQWGECHIICQQKLPFHGSNRVGITIHVKLCKPLEEERVTVYFHSPMERVAHELVQDDFINMINAIISQLNVYCYGGSGWVVETLNFWRSAQPAPSNEQHHLLSRPQLNSKTYTKVCST